MKDNFRRLLSTFEALSDLGPTLTSERSFSETAPRMLASLLNAVDAREGALFRFNDKPAMLSSVASRGFVSFPDPAVLPLLPKHVHALTRLPGALAIDNEWSNYLSSEGNFAPQLLKCLVPLRVGNKLVGMAGLGRRAEDAPYRPDELDGVELLSHYVALALHNHSLTESLAARVSENLKLMASVHNFYDNTLEAFAAAIDIKHVDTHGHSMRTGRYAAGIGDALGLDNNSIAGLRAGGYLHDVGMVAIDKALFGKPARLNEDEFREMADHTIVGSQIVNGIQFPWPKVADVVRSHHERADGSGYPDRLHLDEMSDFVRITAVADTFDAMTSERPYRRGFSISEALMELIKLTPTKYDPTVVQALIIQVRRDSVTAMNQRHSISSPDGIMMPPARPRFLDERLSVLAPPDVDHIASMLNHKLTHGRTYFA